MEEQVHYGRQDGWHPDPTRQIVAEMNEPALASPLVVAPKEEPVSPDARGIALAQLCQSFYAELRKDVSPFQHEDAMRLLEAFLQGG